MTDLESRSEIFEAFSRNLPVIRVPGKYRLGMLFVALAIVLLPVIYLGIIAATAYGVFYHATENVDVFYLDREIDKKILAYLVPIVAGSALVLFMIKPFVARRPKTRTPYRLKQADQPFLFEFVNRLCKAIGASQPYAIELDLQVNASASFWRGWLGFLSGRLVLTVGLPLVAGLSLRDFAGVIAHEFGHFTQKGGMRLAYLVRSVNNWFARVVYERDEWDLRLQDLASRGAFLFLVFGIAILFIWLSRLVLRVLMMTAQMISSYLLRQMEHHADQYEAMLAGSERAEAITAQMHLLNLSWERALSDTNSSWANKCLADDLTTLVVANLSSVSKEVKESVLDQIKDSKTGLLDTHPSDLDRIQRMQKSKREGIFDPDRWTAIKSENGQANPVPAAVLFSDFESLSMELTRKFYQEVLKLDFEPKNLVPAQSIAEQESGSEDDIRALRRFFQGMIAYPQPLGFDGNLTRENSDSDPTKIKEELGQIRNQLLIKAPDVRADLLELQKAASLRLAAEQSLYLFSQRIDFNVGNLGLESSDPEYLIGLRDGFEAVNEKGRERFSQVRELLKRRLSLAVSCLLNSRDSDATDDLKTDKIGIDDLCALIRQIEAALPIAEDIHLGSAKMIVLTGAMENSSEDVSVGHQIKVARDLGREIVGNLERFYKALEGVPYPFKHSKKGISLAEYIVVRIPKFTVSEDVLKVSIIAFDRAWSTYLRMLGRLASFAERAENGMGLEPPPDPSEGSCLVSGD